MTITENLQMGAFVRNDNEIDADIDKVFAIFPRLKERALQLAGTMSGGEQQMLAMGRALMARPKLLLLDEPSMGLSPIMVDKIFEVVADIHSRGTTVLAGGAERQPRTEPGGPRLCAGLGRRSA
jgi:branched-chain amino acid transport system ATP-binding protein